MMASTAPVLVAGAGPCGLAAALALLQNNVPVRIIDKEPHYRIGQGASALWPRTFEVFHLLRVHEVHQNASRALPIREYKHGTLEPITTHLFTPHNDPTPSVPYNDPLLLGQPKLEGILRSHLEKYGCFVDLGTELRSFEDDGERVLAKLAKRTDSEEVIETFEASYLIGADGAKGVSRRQLGLTFLGETRKDIAAVVGDICVEIEGVDRNYWHFFGDRTTSFCMLRPTDDIAPDGFRIWLIMEDYTPKELISDTNLMFECMSGLIGREIKVRKVVILSEFRPNIRMTDKFGHGRVFVAGDAAHVHSATGGQGLNSSVQDALNLAWKLSLAYKGLSQNTLLDSYTAERLPVIAEMLNITTGLLNKLRREPNMEHAMQRDRRLNMLGVNYRESPIVMDEFANTRPVSPYGNLDEGVLVAGDRAPDAPGLIAAASGAETRLFDLFSPTYHTVLLFTPDASAMLDVPEVLGNYPKDMIKLLVVLPHGSEGIAEVQVNVVVDSFGHAYRAYLAAVGEWKVVVVRPDGVVGAIVRGAQGMQQYFDKIFTT